MNLVSIDLNLYYMIGQSYLSDLESVMFDSMSSITFFRAYYPSNPIIFLDASHLVLLQINEMMVKLQSSHD